MTHTAPEEVHVRVGIATGGIAAAPGTAAMLPSVFPMSRQRPEQRRGVG
jgi:hypothetical protein